MFEILFGSLKYRSKKDWFVLPLKYLYVIYCIPFLVFVILLNMRSGGVLGVQKDKKNGMITLVLFRLSAVVISFGLWIGIAMIVERFS